MQISIKIIDSDSPVIIQPTEDCLLFEDACFKCCREMGVLPASRHLFGLKIVGKEFYVSPCDLLRPGLYELRLRFWPALSKLCLIGSRALNYLYAQVCQDYVDGKITSLNVPSVQDIALGLSVTAMHCHVQDRRGTASETLSNYRRFVPKLVRKNANLRYSVESLRTRLRDLSNNPPGDVTFCKDHFLQVIAMKAPDYLSETYSVKIEEGQDRLEFDLVIQPLHPECPGITLHSLRKKIGNRHICKIEEICFVSIRRSDNRMEISRINGVPQYFLLDNEESIKSCVGALNGYYRLSEKWTFDLCGELGTPCLAKLRSLKCHGPVGDLFAYEKLRSKRHNKQGSYILRENHYRYDEYCLDVCLEEGQPATTFSITKSEIDGKWNLTGLELEPCDSIRDVLANCTEAKLGIQGFELKDCIPSSENDISELLLCRKDAFESSFFNGHQSSPGALQLPFCIPSSSIQLYSGAGLHFEFTGRFTQVHRGIWRRHPDDPPVQIVRKLLKPEYRSIYSQAFLESVQRGLFWRSETIVLIHGIILDTNLSVIMEYLPLGPLDRYLEENELPVLDLVEAATNLAKALFYLEEKGFIHGKIRCRNLMVASHTADSIRVKLADPGIPSYIDDELPWIPIELFGSLEAIHRRSSADIWACGTVMWEIFSGGRKPFTAFAKRSKPQMIQAFIDGWRLPRPESCRGEIYQIMLNTWAPDPSLRPKAQTIMRDINQILYNVYNTRRSNVYEAINPHRRSLNGSMASGLTEATTLLAISEDRDSISLHSQFDDIPCQDTNNSLSFLLSNMAINSSSLTVDDEGASDLGTEIYELERHKLALGHLIGQGFYGEVRMGWIKHSDGTEETVAVKKLKSLALNNPESVDLQRECAIMKSLNHPKIVEIKAVVTIPSTMLVMEYMPMGSLVAYLRSETESGTITDLQLLKFATDVAEGMAFLGENQIVHRDLAARNILVASENLVKISDFGLARHIGNNGYYVVQQNAQKLPMPWYAPESLAYWKFSTQSDVWSYGVTLYEMFSRGADPNFVSGDHSLLLTALQQGRRLPCPPLCPRVVYRELMQPCWEAEASQRPSFNALLGQLRLVESQL